MPRIRVDLSLFPNLNPTWTQRMSVSLTTLMARRGTKRARFMRGHMFWLSLILWITGHWICMLRNVVRTTITQEIT